MSEMKKNAETERKLSFRHSYFFETLVVNFRL
jgi:hypothetical protein